MLTAMNRTDIPSLELGVTADGIDSCQRLPDRIPG